MSSIASWEEADTLRSRLLEDMRALDARYPGEGAFESIINQLAYLEPYLKEGAGRIPRLDDLNFGFLGVKFVEEFSPESSRGLSSLSQFVEHRFGNGDS